VRRVALYGKHPKQKYYRLIAVTLSGQAATTQGRALRDARAIDTWFTKEFPLGQDIPDRYTRAPLTPQMRREPRHRK
jgi:hypothetical protein